MKYLLDTHIILWAEWAWARGRETIDEPRRETMRHWLSRIAS